MPGAYSIIKTYFSKCIIWLLVLLPVKGISQKVFDFNNACREAYKEIVQLKLVKAQQLLQAEKKQRPDNLIPYFLENYIDFFELFFNEDPVTYAARRNNMDKRIQVMNQGPSTSPFYLFTKAVLHFQRASIEVKFGTNWNAGWEFRRSFLQISENAKNHPSFAPNQLYQGAMKCAAGTIPDGYKWLSSLLGIRGSISKGMQQLQQFLGRSDEWSTLFHEEAVFYYCYLKFYVENDKEGVFEFINKQQLDTKDNHLFAYLVANLSINSQHAEMARQTIAARSSSPDYLVTPAWDLELGYAKLNGLETTDASVHFEKFLQQFKGKFYVKDALMKLSWCYYLQGNTQKALQYRNEVLSKGNTNAEADKLAQKEAKSSSWPNTILLQARLLNDGGYYSRALGLLHGKKYTDFTDITHQLEFAYRVGRLYDDVGRKEEAITYYKLAVQLGEKREEYFGARAALQIGNIYEKQNDPKQAIEWYQRCLKMKDHDFKNSIDQRAKAGIARCKGE